MTRTYARRGSTGRLFPQTSSGSQTSLFRRAWLELWPSLEASARHERDVPEPSRDPHLVLSALARQNPSLELGTMDLCFLAALHLRANGEALTAFSEHELFAAFEDVCSLLEPGSEQHRKRATHAIQRLRDQRLLARVDGRGIVQSGEYSLTRLGSAIVDFFLHEEALTRESLTLLTRTLLTTLSEVRRQAEQAHTADDWTRLVVGPLRVTIGDLVAGIERRQRGLDLQQEDFQRRMAALLKADWFGALDNCQALLESTSQTLRELNEILLRDSQQLQETLQEIQDLAVEAGVEAADEAARRVIDQVDRITGWGVTRQRAFSEYYDYVHHFLRDVVRLDPTRALTQRLREQLGGKRGRRFALSVAQAAPLRVLRTVAVEPEPAPVRRPKPEREPVAEVPVEDDARALLEQQVRDALDGGAQSLSVVTAEVSEQLQAEERFVAAGRVAEIVAGLGEPRSARLRPWVAVGDAIEIEEWSLARTGAGQSERGPVAAQEPGSSQ